MMNSIHLRHFAVVVGHTLVVVVDSILVVVVEDLVGSILLLDMVDLVDRTKRS